MSAQTSLPPARFSDTEAAVAAGQSPEPAWDIATLFPPQGQWSEEEYLALDTLRRVEYSHGHIEVLEMPTQSHQMIVGLLYRLLFEFVAALKLGVVLPAGIRVRLWAGKFREPDVVFMRAEHARRRHEAYWDGADLVMEIVSSNRELDMTTKRREYAQAGIPEYWIIDPLLSTIIVLVLKGDAYQQHGAFRTGEVATSATLPGFGVRVDQVFQAE
jgi:Uma2 family endonuclease